MKTTFCLFLFFLVLSPGKHQEALPDAYSSETMINIKLNEGEKWSTDKPTAAHIQTMIDLCEEALSHRTYETAPLREALAQEIDLLIQNTQMTGNARAQLQKYQLGLRKRIETISQDRDTVNWLTDYLDRFFEYFE